MDPNVVPLVAVITGLVAMVGTLSATLVSLRKAKQDERAQIEATYHQLLEDLRAEITRLKERVAELERCLSKYRQEGQPT